MAARLFWIERFIVCFIDVPISQVRLHFLMSRTTYGLALALCLSLLLHITPFLGDLIHFPPPPRPAPPMQAEIRPAALPPPAPPLTLKKPEPTPAPETQKNILPKSSKSIKYENNWQNEVRRQFKKQHDDGLFYPAEAITQGMEGEVLVLMILDETGQVSAARIEQGCAHRLLNEAALKAVRALHSLPADTPREVVLPVRFRLR
jgi:protein TonB